MQAHKLSTYNTELSNCDVARRAQGCGEGKVELVKGKPMLTTVMKKPVQNKVSESVSSGETVNQFDFAGLAG